MQKLNKKHTVFGKGSREEMVDYSQYCMSSLAEASVVCQVTLPREFLILHTQHSQRETFFLLLSFSCT